MNILFSSENNTPLYQQIVNSIRSDILTGKLKADEPIPSIRSLSKSAETSIITVKKAYDELEKMGLIYTIKGKGSFVSYQEIDRIRDFKLIELQEELSIILNSAKDFGINKNTIIDIIKLL